MANDLWRTPQWLFNWLNDLYGPFDIDLAARRDNALCANFYTIQDNALDQNWHRSYSNGFCNPPYSNLPPWLAWARTQSIIGFKSTWILPAWNGDRHWRYNLFEGAAKDVIQIYGRISFLDFDGKPITGNRGGTVIAHYHGQPYNSAASLIHVDRDDLIKRYSK